MKATGSCVSFYKSGVATIRVNFPNGDTVCRWCQYVRYDESLRRHRCLFTGEYLPFPIKTRGNECPIAFDEEET